MASWEVSSSSSRSNRSVRRCGRWRRWRRGGVAGAEGILVGVDHDGVGIGGVREVAVDRFGRGGFLRCAGEMALGDERKRGGQAGHAEERTAGGFRKKRQRGDDDMAVTCRVSFGMGLQTLYRIDTARMRR